MNYDPEISEWFGLDVDKKPLPVLDVEALGRAFDLEDRQVPVSNQVVRQIESDDFIKSVLGEDPHPSPNVVEVQDEFMKSIVGDSVSPITPVIVPPTRPTAPTQRQKTKTPPDRRTKLRQFLQPLLDLYQISGEQSEECQQAIENCLTSMSQYVENCMKAA